MSWLRHHVQHQLRLFFLALQFFTRIPIPAWVGFDQQWLQQSVRYFPAVGWVVGLFSAGIYVLAHSLFPQTVAVVLASIGGILLTGAFHEDGFADVCDGLGGGMTKARMLEIMSDSRVGAYGAIGIVMMLLLKMACLTSLPANQLVWLLLVAHPVSRLAAVSLIATLEYVKPEGKAKPLAQQMRGIEFLLACITVVMPILGILYLTELRWKTLLSASLVLTLATLWMARLFVRKLGGYTGDCLGAAQQVAEVCFYLGALAVSA